MTDYKVLWQQMCERCDELDKKLAQQETLLWIDKMVIDVPNQILYTAPQRTWVGLTDTEIKLQWSEFWKTDCHAWSIEFARAIEAKLKEKNT